MKQVITIIFYLMINQICLAQDNSKTTNKNALPKEPLTELTFENATLTISDFSNTENGLVRYPREKESIEYGKQAKNKIQIYAVKDDEMKSLGGVGGTLLSIVAHGDTIKEYFLRVEGIENVEKLSSIILNQYPEMKSYRDGTLRFKQFIDSSTVLQMWVIASDDMSDVFMDIGYTRWYGKSRFINMYEGYDNEASDKLKKIEFTYDDNGKLYDIGKVDRQ